MEERQVRTCSDESRNLKVSDWVLRRREDDDYQEDEEKLDLGKFEGDWTEKEKQRLE